ncbi:bacteriocin immunity protein [Pediococcus argentinicus]|uniref:Bacteriocin immunity protein n=1 Tax=Pediococcus argentinicus TaxID=480391 RepID=A0A0R2N8X5_9LACO|nr:bacteriocin immunity protein [Pediococcus argentinicus]KRO20875.1 hypothetical protein IV88_GL001477 [Pediococcus argentinicus]NKZ23168.1 bacteriocin immunity protein [Pediococcus argentinicus]GEP20346.1 hypothetical protein LSA03_17300 [Pediococcus argentinicus]
MTKRAAALLKKMDNVLENEDIRDNERQILEASKKELVKSGNDLREAAQLESILRPYALKQSLSKPMGLFYNDLGSQYGNRRGTFIFPMF